MSFIKKLEQSRTLPFLYYIVAPDNTGRAAWYYIMVDKDKINEFVKNINKLINLSKWGEVIKLGYGEEAPYNIRAQMKEEYGFDHQNS